MKKTIIVAALASLTGCSPYHPTVKSPPLPIASKPGWAATTLTEAVNLVRGSAEFYQQEVSSLVKTQRDLDDLIVGATTGGVLGAIARDVTAVVTFGAFGGTVGIIQQRYRIGTQADIYRKAYKATDCMDTRLIGMDKLHGNESFIPDQKLALLAYALPGKVNEQIRLVRNRLRDQLDAMVLVTPDENTIRSAFAAVAQAQSAVKPPAAPAPGAAAAAKPLPLKNNIDEATFQALYTRLPAVEAELQKCVADNQ